MASRCCASTIPAVQQMIPRLSDHRIVTYGFSPQADVRAERVVPDKLGSTFEVVVTDRFRNRSRRMGPFRLPMLGAHNVQNALAAIAVGIEMEIDDATLRSAFLGFKGVKRRFTKTGEAGGITVIDDYGHHPVEIAAVLKAARQAGARDVVAVVQPHRYSRLQSLFNEFCTCMNDAGTVIVADVYAAGEQPIPGVTRDALVEGLRARGHRSVVALPNPAGWRRWCTRSPVLATSSCASAPDRSRNGRRRCPANSRRCKPAAASGRWRHDGRRPHPGLRRIAAEAARPGAGRCAAGAVHLVPRRRRGRGAGAAGGCRRPGGVPAGPAARGAGAGDRRVLQPDRARRRAAGRDDPPGARLFRDRAEADGIVAGAAALDVTVAEHAAAAGLTGLEFLSGIPGSIGGAVAMNAGAYGGEMATVLDWAEIVTRTGEQRRLPRPSWRSPTATRRCRPAPW